VSPGQLLDELWESYQGLTFEGRKQVTAFLSELSLMAMNPVGELREIRTAGALLRSEFQ
jgi:hypothetical protein